MTYYPAHGGELYDLVNDPHEERNLIADATHRGKTGDLETGDPRLDDYRGRE